MSESSTAHVLEQERSAGRTDGQITSYHGLILRVLQVAGPPGLTVRQLERHVSDRCDELALSLAAVGARFDFDLEGLRMEGLVELNSEGRLALSRLAHAAIQSDD